MADPKFFEAARYRRKAERNALWRGAHAASWLAPHAKLGLYGHALAASGLLFLYGALSGHGRSMLRPLVWLGLANYAAYLFYESAIVPKTTVVGRTARGTWGWMKSLVSSEGTTTTSSIAPEQYRALFEFWWSSAVPLGTLPRAAYEKAVTTLFGADGAPWFVHVGQGAHFALNALFLFLIALALRNHFRVSGPGG